MTSWADDEPLRTSCPQIIEPALVAEPMDMDSDRVSLLWKAAEVLVGDVAEQTWIVCHAVAAGWTPERLLATGHAGWVRTVGHPAGTLQIARANGGGW